MPKPFRFFLIINGARFEVKPLGVDGAKLKMEPEGENVFFRRKFSGTLVFTGTDFQQLYLQETSVQRCEDIFIEIEKYCGGSYSLEWSGIIALSEVKWNPSLFTASVTPKPNDPYRCILDNYAKEYNILPVTQPYPITAKIDMGNALFDFQHVTYDWFNTMPEPETWEIFMDLKYVREYVIFRQYRYDSLVNGQPLDLQNDGWVVIIPDNGAGQSMQARPPGVPGFKPFEFKTPASRLKYPELLFLNCGETPDPTRYITVKVNDGNGTCFKLRSFGPLGPTKYYTLAWEFGKFYFDRNRKLLDVVQILVNKTCPAVAYQEATMISDFFTMPVNYVTGAANQLLNLLLAQKSDIINYKSSEAATKGMLSLKNLLEGLRAAFDVHWFLNEEGKLQIEHISYFEAQQTVDLNIAEYRDYVNGKNAYEYETQKMPRYEKLTFGEAEGEDFKEGLIEYSGACVNYDEGQNTIEKTVSAFMTDLSALMLNGENASKTGFILLAQNNGQVNYEPGDLTGDNILNGHLSAANLLKNYHTYGRVLIAGVRNGKQATFNTVLKTKKQTELAIPDCCNLVVNPFNYYKTELSATGKLNNAELSLKTGMVKLEIMHQPYAIGTGQGERQFDDSFNNSFL